MEEIRGCSKHGLTTHVLGYTRSFDKVKEELDKCICVCANCHREIHAGLIDLSNTGR